jgi:gamma-glutamylputrescine oxidase
VRQGWPKLRQMRTRAIDDGRIASNYLLADDLSRPRLGPAPGKKFEPDSRPIVLVIGAGFTGLSAALRLAELRQASGLQVRIVLAEAARVASGPSGKSAGHVCGLQPSDNAIRAICGPDLAGALLDAAAAATRMVRELIQCYAIECDLRDGYVFIHADGQQTVTE